MTDDKQAGYIYVVSKTRTYVAMSQKQNTATLAVAEGIKR